jgi:exodeoxyribonuclease V beta subunit
VPPPPRTIAPPWRIASFTGLVSGGRGEHAASDHDAHFGERAVRLPAPPPALAPDDILRFPRGPNAGDCLHAIFERIDFADAGGWRDAIAIALARHPQGTTASSGSEVAAHAGMAARMLADVLATKLADDIVLGGVGANARLTELEFCLPLPRLSASGLHARLVAMGYDLPRFALRELEGYLKGFIDLVFQHRGRYYVLDWKSNHLGYACGDYGPQALRAAMAEHGYHLQYLLYALALDRYLRRRVPGYRYDKHFGGVLYVFVRGVRPDWRNADGTPAGVFHHRPAAKTIATLDALFTPVFARPG